MRREYKDDEELLDYVKWSKEVYDTVAAARIERGEHVNTPSVTLWLFHLWYWHDVPIYTGEGYGDDGWHDWRGVSLGKMNGAQAKSRHDAVFGPHQHERQMLLLDTTEVEA